MKKVAVIIGDFQNFSISESIKKNIRELHNSYKEVVVIVRTGALPFTSHFPLPFTMVRRFFGTSANVIPIMECTYDADFSNKVDDAINNFGDHFATYTIYPVEEVIPYTGKNQVNWGYFKNPTKEKSKQVCSDGTDRYRKGIIDGLRSGFGSTHAVVDMGVISSGRLICGTKKKHNGLYCLPGGFVDPNLDSSAENAAEREFFEETGIEISENQWNYLQSKKGTDSRFTRDKNKMMTFVYTYFTDEVLLSKSSDTDDIDELFRLNIEDVDLEKFIEPHREIVREIIKAYECNKKKL